MSIIDTLTGNVNTETVTGKSEQRVIEAARRVFLRYGYKRVTMAEIAEAAGMSRPALYLVFPSREEIFKALLSQVFAAALDEVRDGLARLATSREKLSFAFEVWTVRPFEMMLASPDAKDLYESSYRFAAEVTNSATEGFIAMVAEVLEPLCGRQTRVDLSPVQIARMLTSAAVGFKSSVMTVEQLRESIAGLITIVLASLAGPKRRKHGSGRAK